MNRRTLLLAAGAGIGGLGAAGYAASETGVLTSEPTESTGLVTSPGVFEYLTFGVDTVRWGEAPEQKSALQISFTDTPPDAFRLHRPDGRKVWAESNIREKALERVFGLPINHPGIWELVAQSGGNYESLRLPVEPAFEISNYGLRGETLVADISNPTNAPNYLEYIRITPGARGYGEEYDVNQALMPGESYHLEEPYPFDFYKDVEMSVWADGSIPGTFKTRSFV